MRIAILLCVLAGSLALFGQGCPIDHPPMGPFVVNQRDFLLSFSVRELRLPCAALEPSQVAKLTTGDFISAQSFEIASRDTFPLSEVSYANCTIPVHWLRVGDFEGLVTAASSVHAHPERMTQALFDVSVLVEGDRNDLFVTIGKHLTVLPPPSEGPPTLVLPPHLAPDAGAEDASMPDAASDTAVSDGGAGDAAVVDGSTPDGG